MRTGRKLNKTDGLMKMMMPNHRQIKTKNNLSKIRIDRKTDKTNTISDRTEQQQQQPKKRFMDARFQDAFHFERALIFYVHNS